MTPKQKAKELYDQLFKNCTMTIAGAASLWPPLAKKQAIICVDQIIKEYKGLEKMFNGKMNGLRYWKDVKIEIEKL